MRALLDLLRENEAAVKTMLSLRQAVLREAISYLRILDPEHGEEELVKSFEVARANLPGYEFFR